MSSYVVLGAVSAALQNIIWEAVVRDPALLAIVRSPEAIVFKNPTETARDSAHRLSLWLYQVTEDEFTRNMPAQRPSPTTTQPAAPAVPTYRHIFPPLALNLYYLVTPFAPSSEADQMLLGKTMQVMYDNAIVLVYDEANEVFEELRIMLCRLSLEELTRIWEALQEPYRLSVCYKVRVARITSARDNRGAQVITNLHRLGRPPFVAPEEFGEWLAQN
jgi:hypothetical protein